MTQNTTPSKRDDALFIKSSTQPEDVKRYVRQQVRNPIVFDGNRVWNFSSYEFDRDCFSSKRENEFVIPYGVPGTWAYMFMLLPERIREAELLIYQQGRNEYIAYKNFYREYSGIDSFRDSMETLLNEEVLLL